ncbi:MAG: cytochrome c biogenesis protein CcsA [Aquificaceae bacterium]
MYLLWLGIVCYFLALILSLVYHFTSTFKKPTLFSLFLGFFFYMAHVIKIALHVGSFPFADTYGFYSLLGNGMILFLLLISLKQEQLQMFLAFLSLAGILSSLLALPAEPSPYKSLLYTLHITSALFSYTFALLGGLSSLIKFMVEAKLKQKSLSGFFMPLNLLRRSERLFVNLSFIFFTFTLIFGSLWSRSFFGKHWINDPKLVYVLFLWFYYAILVHLNLLKRIKPKALSYGVIIGAFLVILNLLFIRHEL